VRAAPDDASALIDDDGSDARIRRSKANAFAGEIECFAEEQFVGGESHQSGSFIT
jgi:hypothetical protein